MGADLRALKREALTGLASRLAGTTVQGVAPRTRRNPDAVRLTWDFGNETHALLIVSTLKQGLPAGRFALEPRLLIRGGPLAQALRALPLPPAPAWDTNHLLVNADCSTLGGPTSTFVIRPQDATGLARAEADIQAHVVPAIRGFSGDWVKALDLVLACPSAVAFSGVVAAILIAWTGRTDLVAELRSTAEHDPWVRQSLSHQEFTNLVDERIIPRSASNG